MLQTEDLPSTNFNDYGACTLHVPVIRFTSEKPIDVSKFHTSNTVSETKGFDGNIFFAKHVLEHNHSSHFYINKKSINKQKNFKFSIRNISYS